MFASVRDADCEDASHHEYLPPIERHTISVAMNTEAVDRFLVFRGFLSCFAADDPVLVVRRVRNEQPSHETAVIRHKRASPFRNINSP